MTPENVRGMQCQISDALRDRACRIRNGNDLATVRKVLGEVRESAAEWLRQTGDPDAPGEARETFRLSALDASLPAAARAKMLAAEDIASGRVVGSRGAPGFLVRGIAERRRARELEQDEAKAQRQDGWIKTADRLPTAADHYLGDPLGREAPVRHVPCLAVTFLRPRETELLLWDLRCQCWNDRNGRPFTGNPGDVICWMPLPAPPEVSDGR